MSLYCFENARSAGQIAEMRRLEAAGVCLFCPEGLAGHPWAEVLVTTEHWTVTPNEFPYAGAGTHLLLVPHLHATDLLDLPEPVRADFWLALRRATRDSGMSYYGLGVRNGDCRYTGGTIRHVHAHVLAGDAASADAPPVRMRFSSRPPGVG